MKFEEKEIDIEKVPKILYHIVPIQIFKKYTNFFGTYNPRNRYDFGNNSPFVHTTPSINQINKHLPYLKQIQDKEFYLLEINISKLKPKRITFTKFKGQVYHHLWCSLKKNSFKKRIVKKNKKGEIK